uniref:Uncharacterized protein n=1 Tax=Anguilla anguilla TaxID=7936 RepID=A0A0E9UT14_ANGAN
MRRETRNSCVNAGGVSREHTNIGHSFSK